MSAHTPQVQKESIGSFLTKVLTGMSIGIVVALIPNAIVSELFRYFISQGATWLTPIAQAASLFQFTISILGGVAIGQQFKLAPMQSLAVGGAAFLGSGAWKVVQVDGKSIFQLAGTGDMINIMLISALAVLFIQYVGHYFGSMNLILLPLVSLLIGYIGMLTYPSVSQLNAFIGSIINSFTDLLPLPMSILLCISFAFLIVTPMSTVAMGVALGLTGLAAGASSMGLVATAAILVWGTLKVNKPGVPVAIILGSIKMMMTNCFRNPILFVPIALNAVVCALPVAFFSIVGTPASSGFGIIGLIGPIAAYPTSGLFVTVFAWFIVPFVSGWIINYLCVHVLKLYTYDVFKFNVLD